MSLKLPQGFSFFGGGRPRDETKGGASAERGFSPSLKLQTDKEVYRPGDSVTVTVEICSPRVPRSDDPGAENLGDSISALLVDSLMFEIKGIERLDSQWFTTQKPSPGSKQRRGEHLFLDCVALSIVSKVIVSTGSTKTYIVRAELPTILPPSYKGTTIRYIYYVRSILCGRWLVLENGHRERETIDDLIQLEARAPLQIWVTQKSNNLLNEGSLLATTVQMDIYWREKDTDSEWTRANEIVDGFEEGYDSSRDEISSVSSYNPTKGNADSSFRSSLSLQSMVTRFSNNEVQYSRGERSNFPSYVPLSQLSVAEVLDDSNCGPLSPQKKPTYSSLSLDRTISSSASSNNDVAAPSVPGPVGPVASEGFIRGRSYNIRVDDQVLLRFSPRNSDSTYYFGDTIGGTLTFFNGGARRCLEVSITLETSEIINQRFVHPSRRNSPSITKVQSDHHEIVADLVQTSFLFSVPSDGPMSFSTPYVSVQWALRFEFFTTPKHVDLTRYEHPLLITEREKGDWVLPITVYAPPPRAQTAHSRNEKPLSLESLWIRN